MRVNQGVSLHLLLEEHLVGGPKVSPHKVVLARAVAEEEVPCSAALEVDWSR
jgi:hypothetical protein